MKRALLLIALIPLVAVAATPKNELENAAKPVAKAQPKSTPALDPEYDYHLQAIAAKADAMQQKIQAQVLAQMQTQSSDLLSEQKALLILIAQKYPDYDVASDGVHFVLTPKAKK